MKIVVPAPLVNVILLVLKVGPVPVKLEEFVLVTEFWDIQETSAMIVEMPTTLVVQLQLVKVMSLLYS